MIVKKDVQDIKKQFELFGIDELTSYGVAYWNQALPFLLETIEHQEEKLRRFEHLSPEVLWFAEMMNYKPTDNNLYNLWKEMRDTLQALLTAIDLHRDLGAPASDIINKAVCMANLAVQIAVIANRLEEKNHGDH
mgnify:FL=1